MHLPTPDWLMGITARLAQQGWALYVVGGWVRDRLLGYEAKDIDLSGPAVPDALMSALEEYPGVTIIPKAIAFGTVEIHVRDEQGLHVAEYTTFRSERYCAGGAHRPETVSLGASLREDALRRDFTVNAMYLSLPEGELVDPLGGAADLAAKMLRTTRAANEVFDDDGLRLLRLVRQSAELGFVPEESAWKAASERVGLLRDIAPERIRAELNRMLMADVRYPGRNAEKPPVLSALEALYRLGALPIILPALAAGDGIVQRAKYHDSDVLQHSFRVCMYTPPLLVLRLAGLLHDVGKPSVMRRTGRMVGHDMEGARIARDLLQALRYDRATMDRVAVLVRHHMFDVQATCKPARLRRFLVSLGYDAAEQWVALRRADYLGSREQPEADPAARWAEALARLQVEGVPDKLEGVNLSGDRIASLLGETPSPRIGQIKRALWRHVVQHPHANRPEVLEQLVKRMAQDPGVFNRSVREGDL